MVEDWNLDFTCLNTMPEHYLSHKNANCFDSNGGAKQRRLR